MKLVMDGVERAAALEILLAINTRAARLEEANREYLATELRDASQELDRQIIEQQ